MYKLLIALCVALFPVQTVAEDQAIAQLFSQQGVEGTIVISSLQSGQIFTHNAPRANRRFTVASTFKILNTLIALEEKAISGKDDVFDWDGHAYAISTWNRNQTLESAFKVSCVWCYQELARRVGAAKYRNYILKSAYGELREPFVETTFWLDGALKISAIEHVDFLKKVYQQSLPFSKTTYDTLRQIMIAEQAPTFTIRAKTGVAGDSQPEIGWYVGYVETAKDVWFFALNLDIRNDKDVPLRLKLTRDALETKRVFE